MLTQASPEAKKHKKSKHLKVETKVKRGSMNSSQKSPEIKSAALSVAKLHSDEKDKDSDKNSLYSVQSMLSRRNHCPTPDKLSARRSNDSSRKSFDNSDDARSYEEFKRKRRMALRKKRAQKIINELKDPTNFFQGKTTLPRK